MAKITGERKAVTNDTHDTSVEIPEALKLFGHEAYVNACKAARTVLSEVADGDLGIRKLEGEILLKREGNATKLLRLAVSCVALTKKGNKAILSNAAILFRDACREAEENFMQSYLKANPTTESLRIQSLVPSWPVLKSDFYNAMFKAELNPEKFVKPSEFRDAYKNWKGNSTNAGEVSTRGRKEGSGALQAGTLAPTEVVAEFSNNLKTALRTLLGTIKGMTEEQQDEAAKRITVMAKELQGLIQADASSGGRVAPKVPHIPARESERA